MKKLILKILAWILFFAMGTGFCYYALIMWCWEIDHCFGM